MKRIIYFLVPAIAIVLLGSTMYQKDQGWFKPTSQDQEHEKLDPNKNRTWSAQ